MTSYLKTQIPKRETGMMKLQKLGFGVVMLAVFVVKFTKTFPWSYLFSSFLSDFFSRIQS